MQRQALALHRCRLASHRGDSLEPHEVVSLIADPQGRSKRTHVTDDSSWLSGPPYGVPEHVFDESDIQGCSLDRDDDITIKALSDLETLIRDTNFDIEPHCNARGRNGSCRSG